MATAWVLTPWLGDGRSAETAYRPAVADHFALDGWADPIGQALAGRGALPPLTAVRATCSDAVLAAIKADPRYADAVVWDDARALDGALTQAELDATIARFRAAGWTLQQARAAFGTAPGGRTRAQMLDAVRTALRGL